MKNKIAVILALVGATTLAGCSSPPEGDVRVLCPIIGGAFGSVAGGGGMVGGVIAGALICSNPDLDGDGVANSIDECPDTPAGAKVDERGCEIVEEVIVEEIVVEEVVIEEVAVVAVAAAVLIPESCEQYVLIEDNKIMSFEHILFGFNKDEYHHDEQHKVECIAKTVIANDLKIDAVGYTDNIGDPGYNIELSNRRAHNVGVALLAAGVTRDAAVEEGKGIAAPIASNATEEGRAHNRRVEVRVYH
ncbi:MULTISPECIES: OmpA family protein [unclassified Agarivorans]|uniref:OmpA family protein n=1 Tax=unclassified Agarivorans TaxID=2636026 RepID=UPI0026E15E55|nr:MULTISPECIES: OmpA family protein [unclassified Agarivorans]MDO6685140.1 OmpA family protein [Agarivorans sp. 3_MG-2023]MDO6715688.1 OmpA family protein [Agarivorans sp. 2_MG-2023]